jgi:hypothetical protein
VVCGLSFGTSENGKVSACRRSDGTVQGPLVVTDPASGSEAHGMCRDDQLSGALIRWRAGRLIEILSMHDGKLDGLDLELDGRRLLGERRFLASPPTLEGP